LTIDIETFVCAVKGHATPARVVGVLGPDDRGFGIDVHPTWRISRCLRCDAWIGASPPAAPERERLAPLSELDLPRRGKPLRQALILRVISVERAVHSVVFAAIAILGLVLRSHLAGVKSAVQRFLVTLAQDQSQTGQANSNGIVVREGTKILRLRSGTLEVLIVTAAIYAVVEGAEAVGLWYERRWAEYLTALATAGFLPFEVHELAKKVTVIRAGALVVNVAVVVYLVFAKRLFGIGSRRGAGSVEGGAGAEIPFSPPF
jgi:uncharacterized membrane protein (DUF2068 family)